MGGEAGISAIGLYSVTPRRMRYNNMYTYAQKDGPSAGQGLLPAQLSGDGRGGVGLSAR